MRCKMEFSGLVSVPHQHKSEFCFLPHSTAYFSTCWDLMVPIHQHSNYSGLHGSGRDEWSCPPSRYKRRPHLQWAYIILYQLTIEFWVDMYINLEVFRSGDQSKVISPSLLVSMWLQIIDLPPDLLIYWQYCFHEPSKAKSDILAPFPKSKASFRRNQETTCSLTLSYSSSEPMRVALNALNWQLPSPTTECSRWPASRIRWRIDLLPEQYWRLRDL